MLWLIVPYCCCSNILPTGWISIVYRLPSVVEADDEDGSRCFHARGLIAIVPYDETIRRHWEMSGRRNRYKDLLQR